MLKIEIELKIIFLINFMEIITQKSLTKNNDHYLK